ncbi:MAG: helix-turn-helix domain-containing transcriptional regulator, partial [Alphaproteobacteria bacterium]
MWRTQRQPASRYRNRQGACRGIGDRSMTIELTKWYSADHLTTKDDVAAYLEAVFEDGDSGLITHALGVVARAEGMTE